MKKILRLTSFYLLLIIIISSCKQNITQNDYPDSDAVYIKMTKEYTLNEDGTMDYHYSHQLKLFTYFAFNSKYGETFIVYNPKFQNLKVNKSFTINEKGENIPSPDNAFNEVLPQFAANAPAYNYLREMVVTHTGLERNSTITLDYNISTKKDFLPALSGNEILNTSSPIRELEMIIKIPKTKKLYYKLINSDIKPDSTEENNFKIYKWNFKEIASQSYEPMQPSDSRNLVHLIYSTSDKINENLSQIISQPAFKYEVNEKIIKGISDIINSKKQVIEKALDLQKKVVEEFNYFPIPPFYTGYKCRTANEVWKSNGGTEIEKAVLLNALLKNANINSEILAYSNANLTGFPSILFDNFILKVTLQNKEIFYLSPVHIYDNNLVYDLQWKTYYPLTDNSKISDLTVNNYSNSITVKGNLEIEKSILKGKVSAELNNKFSPYFKLTSSSESAKSLFPNSKDAKIISVNSKKSVIDFNYENNKAGRNQKNYSFFSLPEINNGLSTWGINFMTEKRNTPIELQSNINEIYQYSITLPANYSLFNPVKEIKIDNSIGIFTFKTKQEENIITVIKGIYIKQNIIEPKDYEEFKTLIDCWNNKKYKDLVVNSK